MADREAKIMRIGRVLAHGIAAAALCLTMHVAASAATYHVDPSRGDDTANGSEAQPWRTVGHAMEQLEPGDTLLLHGGRYFERVNCSIQGTAEAPITIRGADDAPAIIDGGWRVFHEAPERAWEPVPEAEGGAPGEFRSTRTYRNVPDVAGSFINRPIRLSTYWRLGDLRSDNEVARYHPEAKVLTSSVYAGPGLWYNRKTGRIHVRLAHTSIDSPLVERYTGETDPRKLPLTVTSIRSIPLTIDGARHVRFENLTLTGGGLITVLINESQRVTLDHVTVHAGNVNGQKSGHITLAHCLIQGGSPPWIWRIDVSGGSASSTSPDIVRAGTTKIILDTSHQFMSHNIPRVIRNDMTKLRPIGRSVIEPGTPDAKTPQMVNPPVNHDWEIAYCEIRDGHDGAFLCGRDMSFHHNVIDDMRDDAFDPSSPVPGITDNMHVHHNLIRRCVTAISTHNQGAPDGRVYVYRNVIDLREPGPWSRPQQNGTAAKSFPGMGFFMHGSDAAERIESFFIVHNTFIAKPFSRYFYAHGTMNHQKAGSIRRVFNNIFVYLDDYPRIYVSKALEGRDYKINGNLHWSATDPKPDDYLATVREHAFSEGQWERDSIVADPMFRAFAIEADHTNDYRPQSGSRAVGAAVELPDDTAALENIAGDTIGAFEPNDSPLKVGVDGRITAGEPRE